LHQPTPQNLVTVLKAFTYFKGWQRSNLQLAITVYQPLNKQAEQLLSTYKYRADVHLVVNNQPLRPQLFYNWLSAAYAYIAINTGAQYPVNILQSMACWVPACSVNNPITKAIFSNNIAYFTPTPEKELAQLLVQLYKDETFKQHLVQQGNLYVSNNMQTNNWTNITSN
jgi:hypothetical protein